MPYMTAPEIVERYGVDYLMLPSDHNDDDLADLIPVERALEDASAEIDKYLSSRFDVPLLNVDTDPSLSWVKRCCADLTIFYLAATNDVMTDLITMRFDQCIKQLTKIAEGKINIGGSVPSPAGTNVVSADPRRLTRIKLQGLL